MELSTIRDYINLFLRWAWLIVLVAIVSAASAYGVSKLQTPVFRASVKMSVNPARADFGLTQVISSLLRNYGLQLTTRKMAIQVIEKLQLKDMTPEKLRSELKTSADMGSYILRLDVDDNDPNRAWYIADTIAKIFVEEQTLKNADVDRRDRIEVAVLEPPKPAERIKPRTSTNVLAGGVLGVLIGALIVLAREFLDDTVKSAEEAARLMGVPALGAIPAHQG